MTLNTFLSKYNGKKLDWELLPVIGWSWKRLMSNLKGVFGVKQWVLLSGGNSQVFKPIIVSISVYVVDNLMGQKWSANTLFNYLPVTRLPVLKSRMSANIILNKLHVTRFRAKSLLRSKFSAFESNKHLTTITTFKKPFSRFVVTISITEPGFLGWGGFKFLFTLFANVFHTPIISHNVLRGAT